jgi:hypothetical protein
MRGQTKNIGLRVWNDGLFQRWLLLRLQSFPVYLTSELMKGKLMVKKWKKTLQENGYARRKQLPKF